MAATKETLRESVKRVAELERESYTLTLPDAAECLVELASVQGAGSYFKAMCITMHQLHGDEVLLTVPVDRLSFAMGEVWVLDWLSTQGLSTNAFEVGRTLVGDASEITLGELLDLAGRLAEFV